MLSCVSGKLATVITLCVLALVGAVAATSIRLFGPSGAPPGPLEGYHHPRAIHRAPDGRLVIADLGSGHDDGQVVAIDLAKNTRTVLMDKLPSTTHSGNKYADLAGPSGAAMAADGTVCVVIGYADRPPAEGYNTLRCTDGLRIDLKKFEAEHNPDGLEVDSNPFDIVWGGGDGWLVTDAGANALLLAKRSGEVSVASTFAEVPGKKGVQGVPAGVAKLGSDADMPPGPPFVALYNGGTMFGGARLAGDPARLETERKYAIAVDFAAPQGNVVPGNYVLVYRDDSGERGTGAIYSTADQRDIVIGLDRPTGFARLPDGRFLVSEEARSRVRIVGESAR